MMISSTGIIASTNASIPNGWWYGDWLVEKNFNATVSVKSPLGEFGNITSPTFVDYILAQSPSVSDVWSYVTRTLTNLNDTRADMIDNLDVLLSTRATQASVDVIDGIVDSILVDTNELQVDWVNGGRLDLLIDAIKAKTDTIVANGATQASVDVIDGIVDSILVDTSTIDYQPGYSLIVTSTRANPVQNQWYTILDESTNGYILALTMSQDAGTNKAMEVRVTLDGVADTDSQTAVSGTTYYLYLPTMSNSLTFTTTAVFFMAFANEIGVGVPYSTSIKVEARTTSATWASGFTVNIRRFKP